MQDTANAAATSLPYHEPSIVNILKYSSFLLLLNGVNYILDKAIYCGLLGQVLLGVVWGMPVTKWLDVEAERVIVQLGYLGLLLLVYEGGLSTSIKSLRANLLLSTGLAVTGISLPIGLSFMLSLLTNATPIQCFAAGAALCSTSLGTTFTVLNASGLIQSRLGIVLTSAAMMDDVVGLVMVQVISNLGQRSAQVDAITIVRPLFVSLAFAAAAPIVCTYVAKPVTVYLNNIRKKDSLQGYLNRLLLAQYTAFTLHTAILLACIAGATYAGTSNLFAAYIAGACISWWDAQFPHSVAHRIPPPSSDASDQGNVAATADQQRVDDSASEPAASNTDLCLKSLSGIEVYEKYYLSSVNSILKPFFFASIGFSIPLTQMLSGAIVWKGVVYTLLMMLSKMACGAWLVRFSWKRKIGFLRMRTTLRRLPSQWFRHLCDKTSKEALGTSPTDGQERLNETTPIPAFTSASSAAGNPTSSTSRPEPSGTTSRHAFSAPGVASKPRSIYPASIVGFAMTARGEIGFLISSIAESNGILASSSGDNGTSSNLFLIITWAIVLCTVVGPLAVGLVVQRLKRLKRGVEVEGRLVRADVLGSWGV